MLCIVVTAAMMQACAPLAPRESRAAHSSLGCMRAALADRDLASRPDSEAHCVAAGLIALRCSKPEAWLASLGKELRDLVGRGAAEWADLEADAQGIRCADSATSEGALIECCKRSSPPPATANR